MHICLGHLTVLFGFLSTPSQNWQAECSQCLNGLNRPQPLSLYTRCN